MKCKNEDMLSKCDQCGKKVKTLFSGGAGFICAKCKRELGSGFGSDNQGNGIDAHAMSIMTSPR